MIITESAGFTDIGRKRQGNEDDLLVDDRLGLYVVADGMGGHLAGEVASKMVVSAVKETIKCYKDGKSIEDAHDSDHALSQEANLLLSSIHVANRNVHQASIENDSCQGMGSTVAAIFLSHESLIAANVGDSPIYLVHGKDVELLSVPHTVLAEREALGMDRAQAEGDQFKHVLTRGMGVDETVKPDVSEVKIFKDDILVISSDGLSDKVSPEEIRDIVIEKQPDKACRMLIYLANERGGDDNITVIVLKVKTLIDSKSRLLKRIHEIYQVFKNIFP